MSINQTALRAFHLVAAAGSFSCAANANFISQPTLSTQVRTLEDRCQVKLFQRHGRGIVMTRIGQSLLKITTKLQSLELEAEQLLLATHSKITGTCE